MLTTAFNCGFALFSRTASPRFSTTDVGSTQDIHPEMGITGTPVIDPAMTTMYVVVNTKESAGLIYRLHALDITTGLDKLTPVMLSWLGSRDRAGWCERNGSV